MAIIDMENTYINLYLKVVRLKVQGVYIKYGYMYILARIRERIGVQTIKLFIKSINLTNYVSLGFQQYC